MHFLCSLILLAAAAAQPPTLRPGPHLFIDDFLVAKSTNLTRTTHQPAKLPEPILTKSESWHEMPLFFQQVLRDPVTGKFRMWYNVRNNDKSVPFQVYSYAESEDGIHWTKPNLGITEISGSTSNNVFKVVPAFGLIFLDEGAAFSDPSRRYKMAFYSSKAPGISVSFSPDGLHFNDWPGNPFLPEINDIVDGCWDPIRKTYLAVFGLPSRPGDGYTGHTPNAKEGYRRLVGQSTSQDFLNWSPPKRIVAADPAEAGVWEFYGAKPYVRGDLYIGFLRVLRDDLVAATGCRNEPMRQAGIGWTELITSRDGETWTRHREPFINRDTQPGAFDHAMAWFGDCVTVGDQEYVYYCGYSEGHKIGKRQIGLGKLRRNGFVSRDAGRVSGSLLTPAVRIEADGITVNARIEGELRVRIVDEKGVPLPGFGWTALRGDSTAHPVSWKTPLNVLRAKNVRLEFGLRQTDLYGFDLQMVTRTGVSR